MAKTFKVLSALLCYPTTELQQAAAEMRAILSTEVLVAGQSRRALDLLIDDVAAGDIYDLQERYVLLFDRTRALSLHLFEHVHGESRDRGQAMVDLQELYAKSGLANGTSELPDFLPLFLEFLATRPVAEACETLGQTAHILTAIAERLRKRQSSYESVFRALVTLAAEKPAGDVVAALLAGPDPDADDLVALDAAWEDEEVRFGFGQGNECKDGLVARMRAGRRPAPGMPTPTPKRPIVTHS